MKRVLQGSSKYNKPKLGNFNIAWDKAKYIPAQLPASARSEEYKDSNRLPVYRLHISGYVDNDVVYIPGLVDTE